MQEYNLYQLLQQKQILDLSHVLNDSVPCWDEPPVLETETIENYENGYFTQKVHFYTGLGTHIDAPKHFNQNSTDIENLKLQSLICETYVIKVEKKVEKYGPSYQINEEDLLNFEEENGLIKDSSLVLFYTGWANYWNDKTKYENKNAQNEFIFPTISKKLAELLVKRQITGIGIDTLSPDLACDFSTHQILLGNSIYIIENINSNTKKLPSTGTVSIIAPLQIQGCAEAPIRLLTFF